MTLGLLDVAALASRLGLVLVQVTVLLLAAILIQRWLLHTAAARHAVLGWALIFCGVCPLIAVVASYAHLETSIALPSTWSPAHFVAKEEPDVPTPLVATIIPSDEQHADAKSTNFVLTVLLTLWAFGSAVSLVRLAMGLRLVRRIRQTARVFSPHAFQSVESSLSVLFKKRTVRIFESDLLTSPVTIGVFRPVILLPANVATQLTPQQLLQVVAHECAHVLRVDPLMGLYQRLLSAAFWFHPLVHMANRQLDRAREDLCDNFVLQTAAPTDYARTLLMFAESYQPLYAGLLAPMMGHTRGGLESRVANLLAKERCTMMRLNRGKSVLIATAFCAAGLSMGAVGFGKAEERLALAGSGALPNVVQFEQGASQFPHGDEIVVKEVRGTADTFENGHIYWIKGTYKLVSQDRAQLAAFVTASKAADGTSHYLTVQTAIVKKGTGEFSLYLPVYCDGWPHVSFYPVDGGDGMGGTYIGTGDRVLKKWWSSGHTDKVSKK